MPLDQSRAPILEALREVQARKPSTYGAPGHHAGKGAQGDVTKLIGGKVFKADVLTLKGVDDRRETKQVRQNAEQLAAEAWGADSCYFSSNGSTLSGQAAILACAGPGDKVLVARNAHKSTIAAVIYAGLELVPLEPDQDPAWDIEHGISAAEVARKLDAHPDAKAVFIVSPTYFGVTSDIAAIAAVCHARGTPLIADEAWGALFPFSSELPEPAIRLGADLSIASVHKSMGALTQASIMLRRSDIVPADHLALTYDLLESTSPSIPIFASMDGTRRTYALHGERLLRSLLQRVRRVRKRLSEIEGVRVMGPEVLNGAGAFGWDETKILIDVSALGVNGYEADDWLEKERKLTLGLSDDRKLLAIFGVGSGFMDAHALVSGIKALARAAQSGSTSWSGPPQALPALDALGTEMALRPSEAFFGATERVPLNEAEGRIIAEMVSPYPPGIPRLLPGQRISSAHIRYIEISRGAGAHAPDPSDMSLRTLRVVKEA
jgi:arginine decarboxylase